VTEREWLSQARPETIEALKTQLKLLAQTGYCMLTPPIAAGLTVFGVLEKTRTAEEALKLINIEQMSLFGPQEPPDDPRIFNRKQADGSYRPLAEFFNGDDRDR
jgi:hypothetical protein